MTEREVADARLRQPRTFSHRPGETGLPRPGAL